MFNIDVMRDRDVANPPYHKYYTACTQKPLNTWLDFEKVFPKNSLNVLKDQYESPQDVDLMVGVVAENKVTPYVGPVGQCIIGEQFRRLKIGDRYHFTHSGPNAFSKGK